MIIKNKPAAPYVQISHSLLDTPGLSFRAKGVLCYLLTKPKNWKVRVRDIMNHTTEGEYAVRAALKELRIAGYAVYETVYDDNGKFNGSTMHVADEALFVDRPENQLLSGNSTLKSADVSAAENENKKIFANPNFPRPQFPQSREIPDCENRLPSNMVGVERRIVIPQFSAEGEKIDSITTTTNKPSRQGRETVGGSSSSEASPFAPSAVGSLTAPQDTGSKNLEEQEEQEVPDDLQDYTSEVNRSMVDELKSKWEETYRIAFKRSPRFTAADEKAFSELIRYFGDMGVRQIIAVMIYAWGAQHTEYEETGFMEHFYCNKFSQKPADLIRTGKNGVMYFEKMMTELNWRGKSDKIEKAHAAIEACKKREQKRS